MRLFSDNNDKSTQIHGKTPPLLSDGGITRGGGVYQGPDLNTGKPPKIFACGAQISDWGKGRGGFYQGGGGLFHGSELIAFVIKRRRRKF